MGRYHINITEIPYQVNKSTLIERIAELVRDDKIDMISDLRDESDQRGMSIIIELKRLNGLGGLARDLRFMTAS